MNIAKALRSQLGGATAVFWFVSIGASTSSFPTSSALAAPGDVASVQISRGGVAAQPRAAYDSVSIAVSGSTGAAVSRSFGAREKALLPLLDDDGKPLRDGVYRYEVRVGAHVDPGARASVQAERQGEETGGDGGGGILLGASAEPLIEGGGFTLRGGDPVVGGSGQEPERGDPAIQDQVIAGDLIVQGSGCFGFDCVDDESFSFDTLRLKENNLRIGFEDTSTGTFPANDWEITANDSADGGVSRFSITDVTGAKVPFTVLAGAPSHSLFVSSTGKIGLRTGAPVLDLHLVSGNTPAIRLDQDGSSGFTPQTWDVASNEAGFFVRDVTGGSRLPFRIRPGAPTSSLEISSAGNVGIGTSAPSASLHVHRSDGTTQVVVAESSAGTATRRLLDLSNNGGIRTRMTDTSTGVSWGANNIASNYVLTTGGTGVTAFSLNPTGNLTIAGTLTQNSDRNSKEGLVPVDPDQVLDRVASLPISTWRFKADESAARHMGPMAQDFSAAFGLGIDDHHLAPIDVDGVALSSIQALDRKLKAKDQELRALTARNTDLEARVRTLESAVSALTQQRVQPPAP